MDNGCSGATFSRRPSNLEWFTWCKNTEISRDVVSYLGLEKKVVLNDSYLK